MQWIYDFIRKCPQAVVKGPVPIGCIMEKLKKEYGAEPFPINSFSPCEIQMQEENAFYYAQDEDVELSLDEVQLKAIRIPVTAQSRRYTLKDFVCWTAKDGSDGEDIYVIYEEKSGYFSCNSSMLHLEIVIARGISQEDIKARNPKYVEYLALMQRYIEDYTDFQNQYGLIWSQEMNIL